jgi:hypothetical protein
MPFKKVNISKMIEEQIEKDPEFAKYMEEAEKEFEDIKAGRVNKKFGDWGEEEDE